MGEKLSYQAIFAYYAKDDLVVTVFLDNQPSDDHVGEMMSKLYAIFTK